MTHCSVDQRSCQHTVQEAFSMIGLGLHSSQRVTLTVKPADPDSGIVFERRDLPASQGRIPAHWSRVVNTDYCTTLGNAAGARVGTVEHLLAACSGLGIDNAVIELDGPEVPIFDGSARMFVRLIDNVGLLTQPVPRRVIVIRAPVRVTLGERSALFMPGNGFEVTAQVVFDHPLIGRQTLTRRLDAEIFRRDLANARTFGFTKEAETLTRMGLIRGVTLENALVFSETGVSSPGGQRFPDEPVRHKLLDCLGDLALAGARFVGRLRVNRPGHVLMRALLAELDTRREAWEMIDAHELEPVWRKNDPNETGRLLETQNNSKPRAVI